MARKYRRRDPQFEHAKRILEEMRRLRRLVVRDDEKLTPSQRRMKQRHAVLSELKYKCPGCGKTKTQSRQWRVKLYSARVAEDRMQIGEALCLACVNKEKKMRAEIAEIRYRFNGADLRRYRKMLKLTQTQFGALCGWSTSYQCNLEHGHPVVSQATMKVLRDVLMKHGLKLEPLCSL